MEAPVGSAAATGSPGRLDALLGFPAKARTELAARLGPLELVLLAILVVVPVAFMWGFASPSYFHTDDFAHLYWAHNSDNVWSYAFEPAFGHLAPGYRLLYLTVDRLAPMNFELALAVLLGCHAVSAVLLQRILTLLFGRAWWTYALAFAWAISAVYLAPFAYFAAGVHSIVATTATLASIHGYLCWRVTGRRAWLAWSLVAMVAGLAFYEKPLLIPLYLILMRVLLLDPTARLRDSLRSVRDEWWVWLAYAAVGAAFLLVFFLGNYSPPESSATVAEVLHYLQVFWVEGFSPLVLGVRVPLYGQEDWHAIAIVAAQLALIGLVVWSVARRRVAWRAWVFLVVAVTANALMVVGRVAELGAEVIGYNIYYYQEAALLVPLAIAFAFAAPRLPARVGAVEQAPPVARTAAPPWWSRRPRPAAERSGFQLPTERVGAAALLALGVYMSVTWATADTYSSRSEADPEQQDAQSGRFTRNYFDNLRRELATTRRAGEQPSLLDHDVPEAAVSQLTNFDGLPRGVRYSLLSSVVPLFDEQVTFNQPGNLHIVRPDGRLRRTRFVAAARWSSAGQSRARRPSVHGARVERRRGECVVAEGAGAALGESYVQWEPRPHLVGRDWWLRVRYRTDPGQPFGVQNNAGVGWADEGTKLEPIDTTGTALIPLGELPTGEPTNAGVRLMIPPFGRLCLGSLEIGSFDPSAPPVTAGGETQ